MSDVVCAELLIYCGIKDPKGYAMSHMEMCIHEKVINEKAHSTANKSEISPLLCSLVLFRTDKGWRINEMASDIYFIDKYIRPSFYSITALVTKSWRIYIIQLPLHLQICK